MLNIFRKKRALSICLIIIIQICLYVYFKSANSVRNFNDDQNLLLSTENKQLISYKHFCECPSFRNEHILVEQYNSNLRDGSIILISHLKLKRYQIEGRIQNYQIQNVILNVTIAQLKNETITCDLYNVLRRGKNQKVIAYSLYGKDRIYYRNIENILQQMRTKYKGYIVRIYYEDTIDEHLRCHLECKYPDVVDFCNVNRFSTSIYDQIKSGSKIFKDLNYMHKMMWRFLSIGDTFVDVFMSRDTDSSFIDREIDSVNLWLSSNTYGHIMRDHPYHVRHILGGLWGTHNSINRNLSKHIFNVIINKYICKTYNPTGKSPKVFDQYFLRDYVYELIKDNSTIHDSYACETFNDSKPFPSRRNVENYIGSVYRPHRRPFKIAECPLKCRPIDHQDWIYC